MKCLMRNKIKFYYSKYSKKETIIDEYGNYTGEYHIEYEPPLICFGNISATRGEVNSAPFGENEDYDKVIVLDRYSPNIDEYTVLWVDIIPEMKAGKIVTPHNYIVKKVARSLNSVIIAIDRVNVSD